MATSQRPNRLIRESRLLVSRPEVVFVELEKYGEHLNEDFEASLLAREDPLIDLALAQQCHDKEVWKALFRKSQATAEGLLEERYLKGLRQACLSNQNAGSIVSEFPHIDNEKFVAFIRGGNCDDLQTLLKNPAIDEEILVKLFKGEGPFTELDDEDRQLLFYSASQNPRLIQRRKHAPPDFAYDEIRQSIFELIAKAPLTQHWLYILHQLHLSLLPGENVPVRVPVTDVLDRWGAPLPPTDDQEEEERGGFYSTLTTREEFIVIAAAMYGRYSYVAGGQYKFEIVGALDSPELEQRCAYYGNAKLTVSDMQEANERDGEAYVLAALCNESLYLDRECRGLLEDQIDSDQRLLYSGRCEAIAKRKTGFNSKPLYEDLFQDHGSQVNASTNDHRTSSMTVERAREIWFSVGLNQARRKNPVMPHTDDGFVTLAGSFSADQLEAMALLIRAGDI